MDLIAILGLLIGIGAIVVGNVVEGGTTAHLVQAAAAMIVLGGTAGATMLSFPPKDLVTAFNSLGMVFSKKDQDPRLIIEDSVNILIQARRMGLIALQPQIMEIENSFLRKGFNLVVDGMPPRMIRDILDQEISTFETGMRRSAKVFETAGGYAPTIGILGAVLGLIQVMSNVADPSKIGSGISVAFVATIYGVGSANLILKKSSSSFQVGLAKFADDDSVKAIIIHVNSPGGGVAASEEIYREVKRIRDEKKKRIVASIETVGASGAYYVASATNKIYADKGSVVGSIGVIAQWVNYGELLKWAKLNAITLKAGEFKDTGSPTREMTPAEREYMQGLIDNMHTQFIQAVADGRHAKEADIRAIANGKVWTGQQAADLKLVDQIADFEGAVKDTAQAVNISGEPTLVYPPKDRRSGSICCLAMFPIICPRGRSCWSSRSAFTIFGSSHQFPVLSPQSVAAGFLLRTEN